MDYYSLNLVRTSLVGHSKATLLAMDTFKKTLLTKAAAIRVPEFFRVRPNNALYYTCNRNGVSVCALRGNALSDDQRKKIMTYRLAQYVALDFVSTPRVQEAGVEYEPISETCSSEVHVIAGTAEAGEILCYLVLKGVLDASTGVTMRERERPHFPVEQIFGWAIYNHLNSFSDLPIARVRELGRFVKNQQRSKLDPLLIRAPIEVTVAMMQLMVGLLRAEVDVLIGDFEENVAKRNIEYLHVPLVVLRGVVPCVSKDNFLSSRFEMKSVFPFAISTSDLLRSTDRLFAVQRALDLPGKQGLAALLALKQDDTTMLTRSSLEPVGGIVSLYKGERHRKVRGKYREVLRRDHEGKYWPRA
jgi:hypothetical protein